MKRLDENIRILRQFPKNWMIFGEKIELKVDVNQHIFYQIYKLLHAHDFFCVFFMNY